jgi:hypothetical protein
MSTASAFDDFADDFLGERTPRLIIIVGASKVDALLYNILAAYLLPKRAKSNEQDELLEGDRPLGTFSSRIKMCYRLAIVDESLYSILETLRSMRNASAHAIAFDAGTSPLREHIAELRRRVEPRSSYKWTRERYFVTPSLSKTEELQCLLLTICVLLEGIRKKTARTRANKTTIAISKR